MPNGKELTAESKASLDAWLQNTALGKKFALLHVWGLSGEIIYSRNRSLIGREFPPNEGLVAAHLGNVTARIIKPSNNEIERELFNKYDLVIESYVPIWDEKQDNMVAVAEFFLTTEELDREAWAAEMQSWLVVAGVFALAYFLLYRIVRNGSNMIDNQENALIKQLELVTALNHQNEQLSERVRAAAAKVATLNEDFLHRISADLHDGPAQDIGLALMKVKTLCNGYAAGQRESQLQAMGPQELSAVQSLLQTALGELREISAGLQLPNLSSLSVKDIVIRAIHDYRLKVNISVDLCLPEVECDADLPVKITLYRILQESLLNGYRHAGGRKQNVRIRCSEGAVLVDIHDGGNGFDMQTVPERGHLGIKGMRERVEALSGEFRIDSAPGRGTDVHVKLPVTISGDSHD
jgi:signal transduction histidine kinase